MIEYLQDLWQHFSSAGGLSFTALIITIGFMYCMFHVRQIQNICFPKFDEVTDIVKKYKEKGSITANEAMLVVGLSVNALSRGIIIAAIVSGLLHFSG